MIEGKLSLVLPAHNEEENIAEVVRDAAMVLPTAFSDYEVIVVNDGSKDRTGEIAARLVAENDHVRLVTHEINKGYGQSLIDGFAAAEGEYIMFTDSDRQFDLNDIHRLASYVPHYDIVAGYRIKRQDPRIRLLYAAIFNLAVKLLFNIQVRDIDCAFKIFHAEVLKDIDLQSPGALINTEIMAKAQKRGRSVTEVGVNHYPRSAGEQSGGSIKVVTRAMRETVRLFFRMQSYTPPDGVVVPGEPNATLRAVVGGSSAVLTLLLVLSLRSKKK